MSRRQLLLNDKDQAVGECVLYVMSRDQRVQDNHALHAAQASANESGLPLLVAFNVLPKTGVRSREHFEFMIDGLKQVAADLADLQIRFVMTQGKPVEQIVRLAERLQPKEVFFDLNPLRGPRAVQKEIAAKAGVRCSVIDAHNVIPLWVLSDKEEYAAHTIRSKVHKNLAEWLTEPPKISRHEYELATSIDAPNWAAIGKHLASIPSSGVVVEHLSGERAAADALRDFIERRLTAYASERNLPTVAGQSELSPYLHYGQLSAQRVAYEVMQTVDQPPLLFREGKLASYEDEPTHQDSVDAFLEELIVRRELADNYCFYNPHYDSLDGAKGWARDSLEAHAKDNRDYIYSLEEWRAAKTHDEAWNAAQKQMMKTGKMHGYMRMYWAKKILEWSISPEEAVATAMYLNDHYSLDGGDPNGYTGIMWSIAGVHDRPWFEREVYGKIRYMNEGGLKRKFNLQEYIDTWK